MSNIFSFNLRFYHYLYYNFKTSDVFYDFELSQAKTDYINSSYDNLTIE